MSVQSTASDTVLYLRPSSPASAAADPLCRDFRDAYEALARDIAQRAVSEGKMGRQLVGGGPGEFEIQLGEWRAALREARVQLGHLQNDTSSDDSMLKMTKPNLASIKVEDGKMNHLSLSPAPFDDSPTIVDRTQEPKVGADHDPSSRQSSSSFKNERYDRPAQIGHVPVQTAHVLWLGNLVQSTTLAQLRDLLFGDIPSAHYLRSILHLPQSKCAFANYSSEKAMTRALRVFNGRILDRGGQYEPIHLICKVRKPEEIEKGPHQRGIHKLGLQSDRPVKSSPLASTGLQKHTSNSSMSTASTTSTFLARYYPTRYFILKSRTVNELEKAAETNRWRPQLHNEAMLRRAHRGGEVIIIFSANSTGSFWGVARMAGSLDRGKSAQSELSIEQADGKTASVPLPMKEEKDEIMKRHTALPLPLKERLDRDGVDGPPLKTKPPLLRLPSSNPSLSASPIQLSPNEEKAKINLDTSPTSANSEEPIRRDFLDPLSQPKVNIESPEGVEEVDDDDTGMDNPRESTDPLDDNVPPPGIIGEAGKGLFWEREHHPDDCPTNEAAVTGTTPEMALAVPFPLEWLFTTPLPFAQVKGLRNPWNGNKEVKVARDGVEVEPGVGRQILGAFWSHMNRPKDTPDNSNWRRHQEQQPRRHDGGHQASMASDWMNHAPTWHKERGWDGQIDLSSHHFGHTSPPISNGLPSASPGTSFSPFSTTTAPTPEPRYTPNQAGGFSEMPWGELSAMPPNYHHYQTLKQYPTGYPRTNQMRY